MPDVLYLYEEGPCLVVCKPAGLLTQAPPGIDSLERRVKDFLQQRDAPPWPVYLGVPHRLDRPVSGALVLAKNKRATRRLSKQFEHKEITKRYWACVEGQVTPAAGEWRDHLRKIPDEPRAEVVPPEHADARQAVLRYRTLGHTRFGAWLEIELVTGRMHQIRVQAASRGFPVLGDEQYGSTVAFGQPHDDRRLRSIALHGRTLGFLHPKSKQPVSITAALPADWQSLGLPEET